MGLLLYNQGTVCRDRFDFLAAAAICKEMGFLGYNRWTTEESFAIQSNYDVKLVDVVCYDKNWSRCDYDADSPNCEHTQDVFLECNMGKSLLQNSTHSPNFSTV